ncbi:MAG: transposase [Pirellulales bacterium]
MSVQTLHIAPGSPWQSGYVESFHSRFADEFLSVEILESLAAEKRQTAAWKDDYNYYRPHSSLGYVAPAEFAIRCDASAPATATPQPALEQHSGNSPNPHLHNGWYRKSEQAMAIG